MAAKVEFRHDARMDESIAPAAKPDTRKVHDKTRHPRLARELKTIRTMARMHCRDLHGTREGLCEQCAALMDYATRRLDRCVFGDDKPTCANCKVHCYNAENREAVRAMMRYSGPRMLLRHPVLAVAHVIDGRRPAPELPKGKSKASIAADAERDEQRTRSA
jgi:hypothetical protein